MKVLILSCSTGGGHNAAAYALAEQFIKEGHEAQVMDHLKLAGEKVSEEVGNLYVKSVQTMPSVFGGVYRIGMAVSKKVKHSPIYYANSLVAGQLEEYLKTHHYDAILMSHLYPAETITCLKRKGLALPLTIAVSTDYTCIPFWEETECDYLITPHQELIREYVKRGIPRDRLIGLGIPVSSRFNRKTTRREARTRLRINQTGRMYLVAGGSMGAGDLAKLASGIYKKIEPGDGMVVICGNNHSLYNKLMSKYGKRHNVRIVTRTEHMALYMKACDVIFTKPGGLTSTEAAAAGIPIVHTKPIPGCETENRNFFVSHGMSVSPNSVQAQILAGVALASRKDKSERMRRAQSKYGNADAARRIVHFVCRELGTMNHSSQ